MNDDNKSRDLDLEWENRVLCSDESCIGTIGSDGRCRVCGRPYEGVLPKVSENTQADEPAPASGGQQDGLDDAQSSGNDGVPTDEGPADELPPPSAEDEWERRRLCSDESCIGVIGPDGRCKECGKPA